MLPDCLRGVSFASDIVVVDSGSTDRTVEIARSLGCRVFEEEWKGYGPQKNSAVDKCRHEWVLIIDADERIPKETKKEILRIIKSPDSGDAYSFPRKNFFHNKWMRYCGLWPDRTVRLVRKSRGTFQSAVHERWVTSGILGSSDAPIEHYSFSDYSDLFNTLDKHSTIMAKILYDEGRSAHIFQPFYHGLIMFIKVYILKLGFLEGMDGFMIALTKAGGSFMKYAKLRELNLEKRK
jgi:glycosyltransferase involved in cell wall biosynthesis